VTLPNDAGLSVRRAGPGDEEALRAVRLRALRDSPSAFGSTYEREVDRTPEQWGQWFGPAGLFFLERGAVVSGLAAAMPEPTDASIFHLRAMWVDPALRGTGAASRLIRQAIDFARAAGARQMRLLVIADNVAARRCYEREGFRSSGRTSVRERDGAAELEMVRQIGERTG
jgi:GNAT superfamily N-acetyltransferase